MFKTLIILSIFRVAFVGDPQADNATQVYYAQKSIYRELKERRDLDLVIVLGDIVNDETGLLGPSKASLDSLGCPWFCVPGNHDRDLYRNDKSRSRDLSNWKKEMRYVDTAFVMNGVQFILMNDVRTVGKADYEAGLLESQKKWLSDVLAGTPADRLTVFASHIPLTEMHDRDSLEMMFAGRERLLLVSGHTHQVRREMLTLGGRKVESLVAGTSCGSWWRGFRDSAGVPDALMNCGSPRGYFIADFKREGYDLQWQTLTADGPGDDAFPFPGAQASVSATDSTLVVNVFGGCLDGRVKLRGMRSKFTRRDLIAPEVQSRIDFNSSMTREYRREHQEEYIPMRRLASPHVWAADIPDAQGFKGKKVTVTYRDNHMKFQERIRVN